MPLLHFRQYGFPGSPIWSEFLTLHVVYFAVIGLWQNALVHQIRFRFVCNLVTQWQTSNTLTNLKSPYYTKRRLIHNLMYHTFSYCSKKFIHACAESSAHAQGTKFRGGNIKHWPLTRMCTNGHWAMIQRQGHFTKCLALPLILSNVKGV